MRGSLFALLLVAVAGCGSSKPETVPAGGKVAYRKATLPVGALVVFHPTDPAFEKAIGGKPYAKVKDDGTFELSTFGENDGAPPGEYGVTVDWRPAAKGGKFALGGDGGGATGAPALNAKYSNPQQPFTKVTVKKGEPNRFEFNVD